VTRLQPLKLDIARSTSACELQLVIWGGHAADHTGRSHLSAQGELAVDDQAGEVNYGTVRSARLMMTVASRGAPIVQ
jgi:hypothetical protein